MPHGPGRGRSGGTRTPGVSSGAGSGPLLLSESVSGAPTVCASLGVGRRRATKGASPGPLLASNSQAQRHSASDSQTARCTWFSMPVWWRHPTDLHLNRQSFKSPIQFDKLAGPDRWHPHVEPQEEHCKSASDWGKIVNMDQGNSRQLFIHLIKDILKARGAKVKQQQVQEFLEFVEQVCPWFSKHRTLDADTWRRIGAKIQQHSNKHGPGKVSVGAPSLWALIQDSLNLHPEGQKVFPPETVKSETKPSALLKEPLDSDTFTELLDDDQFDPVEAEFEEERTGYSNEKFSPPQIQTVNVKGQKPGDEIEEELKGLRELVVSLSQKLESLQVSSRKGTPLPTVVAGLDPPGEPSVVQRLPTVWQTLTVSHMSPLEASVKEAASRGEDVQGFQMFQVIEQRDAQGNIILVRMPVLFKQLKELKMACSLYGPTAPFTRGLLEDITVMILTPGDWKLIARACLSREHYLWWKAEFMEQCEATAARNRAQQSSITFDMLAGEGIYQTTDQQLNFDLAAYAQVEMAAKMAWNRLPCTGMRTVDLSKIRQGPDELFQDFVSRLREATSRLIGDTEDRFVKGLAYENANAVCQAALRPYRNKGNLSDYIRLCSDIGPSYTQGLAMAAALQGKTVKDILFQQRNQGLRKGRAVGSSGSCFGCGRMGHKVKQCPDERKSVGTKKEPGLCPKCKRGKHWANECRSKKDAHGNPLPGRGQRGLPQGPRQCCGVLQKSVPLQGNGTSAVQNWISALRSAQS